MLHGSLGNWLMAIATSMAMFDFARAGDEVRDAEVRQAIEKSLPFLVEKGQQWIDQRKCVSCHQVPFMVWSLNAASQHGFELDDEKLRQWNDWATNWKSFVAPAQRKEAVQAKVLERNIDTAAELLLLFNQYPASFEGEKARFVEFREHLAMNQTDDGSWNPCGQLPRQRRAGRETREVTTMWTLLALGDSVTADSKANTTEWLASAPKPGQSTEWWAAKILLAEQWGEEQKAITLRGQLLERQNEDGGWPWIEGEQSDGFGTGVALFALRNARSEAETAAIQRARKSLVDAQTKVGSWEVRDTRKGKSDHVSPTATYWGTAWAVIGLLETLD